MLKKVTRPDLEKTLQWRNMPENRHMMFTDHEISMKEHLQWWSKTSRDETKQILIFSIDNNELGVVNFFDIDQKSRTCHWGFYLSSSALKTNAKISIWQKLEQEAIEYAFYRIKCETLLCETFEFNQAVLNMHQRFGFNETSREFREKNGRQEPVIISRLSSEQLPYRRITADCLLLGSSNLDFLKDELVSAAKNYHIKVDVTTFPFAQYQILLSEQEYINRYHDVDYVIVVERIEDILFDNKLIEKPGLSQISIRWNNYLRFIKTIRSKLGGLIFIAKPVSINFDKNNHSKKQIDEQSFTSMMNQLQNLSLELNDIYLIDMNKIVREVGRSNSHPGKYWYLARMPFSQQFNRILSHHILALMMIGQEKNTRLLILDLDNTLWHGVIGEEGYDGIMIKGDYPGNVFQDLQHLFLWFKQNGILLAICSKNDEELAMNVIKNHPDMLIRPQDIVSHRINWKPKGENIMEIAKEVGLGLENVCFIDDNPIERNEVKSRLPEVFVPELPEDISLWPEFIAQLPELKIFTRQQKQKDRTRQYQIKSIINTLTESSQSRAEFLKSLKIHIAIMHYNNNNAQRIIQLINKTNQFNTTSRRFNQSQISQYLKHSECYAVYYSDNSIREEIIGVLMLSKQESTLIIDNFLLSCRYLGRDIEIAVMSWLYDYAKNNRYEKIIGLLIKSKRNTPVQKLYKGLGFILNDNSEYELMIKNNVINRPEWVAVQ